MHLSRKIADAVRSCECFYCCRSAGMRECGGRFVRGQRPLLQVYLLLQERFASAIFVLARESVWLQHAGGVADHQQREC